MMQAPGELRQKYFNEVHALTILAASNNRLEKKNKAGGASCMESHCRKETQRNGKEDKDKKDDDDDIPVCDDSLTQLGNTTWWVELTCKREVYVDNLVMSVCGNEFACLHNRDSMDFMNDEKFGRFILK